MRLDCGFLVRLPRTVAPLTSGPGSAAVSPRFWAPPPHREGLCGSVVALQPSVYVNKQTAPIVRATPTECVAQRGWALLFLRPCGWEVMLRSTGAAKPAIGGAPPDSQSESDLGPGRRRGCVVPNKCERLAPFVAVRHLRSNHKNRKKALGVFPICGCDERPFVKPRVQDPHRPPRSRRCVSRAFRGRSIC